MKLTTTTLALLAAMILVPVAARASISFTPLGQLPGVNGGYVNGVSADGTVVVGYSSTSSGDRAYKWVNGTLTQLSNDGSSAYAASSDGSVIVGSENGVGYRWSNTGNSPLEGVWVGHPASAWGVSADGNRAVGFVAGNSVGYWIGTSLGPSQLLPPLANFSYAVDVSDDGTVVAGYSAQGGVWGRATRWVNGVPELLLDPSGNFVDSGARGISADGSVIVGYTMTPGPEWATDQAFRWDASSGIVTLGKLAGDSASDAFDISADGSTIVGRSFSGTSSTAFIWDELNGMRSLKDILTAAGIDLTDWVLTEARGVSQDGYIIAGNGINPNGKAEGWIVDLSPDNPGVVPEPVSMLTWCGLALTAYWGKTARRRRA